MGVGLMVKEDPTQFREMVSRAALTEVKAHAQEHNEAKPGIEEHAEVDDANDDVSQGGDNVEHQVARREVRERTACRWRPSILPQGLTLA